MTSNKQIMVIGLFRSGISSYSRIYFLSGTTYILQQTLVTLVLGGIYMEISVSNYPNNTLLLYCSFNYNLLF